MANLSFGPENVSFSGGVPVRGTAGENLSAGQPFYLKSSDSRYYRTGAANTTIANAAGITQHAAYTGQPIQGSSGGTMTLGAGTGAANGTPYFVSHNTGMMGPIGDVQSGEAVTQLAFCINSTIGTFQMDLSPTSILKA